MIFTIGSLLYSCCKAIVSFSTAIKNNTNSIISLTSYSNGNIKRNVQIGKLSLINFNEGDSILEEAIDSVIVTWNDTIEVVHYLPSKEGNNPKAIKYSNPRNLFNQNAYENNVKELKCDGRHTERTYTFTEQDYQDAKR